MITKIEKVDFEIENSYINQIFNMNNQWLRMNETEANQLLLYLKYKQLEYIYPNPNEINPMTYNINQLHSDINLSRKRDDPIGMKIRKSYDRYAKFYRKEFFDVYCRKNKIKIYFNDTEVVVTSIGQLNYMRWVFSLRHDIFDCLCPGSGSDCKANKGNKGQPQPPVSGTGGAFLLECLRSF